jgi:hypothetical protein
MPTQLQTATYNKILQYFDVAENVLDEVEKLGEKADPIIPFVDKLLVAVEENAEVLVDNFLKYMQSGKPLSGVEKQKMEKAQRIINEAIAEFMSLQNRKNN